MNGPPRDVSSKEISSGDVHDIETITLFDEILDGSIKMRSQAKAVNSFHRIKGKSNLLRARLDDRLISLSSSSFRTIVLLGSYVKNLIG